MNRHPDIHRWPALLAAIGLLVILCASHAGAQLLVIQLEHRPAEEILPVLTPLLAPSERVSGEGFTLFVTADPANLPRIRQVVAQLDRAARQLTVTVVQGANALETLSALAVSGRATIGDHATVGVGAPTGRPHDDHLRIDARHRQRAERIDDIQRIRVQNGQTATIAVGVSAPVAVGSPRHRGVTYHQVVEYRQLVTGVQVTPRVSGDRVILTVDGRRDQPVDDDATVRTQQIQTQVQGRLGEWIDLGAILASSASRTDGIGHGASASRSSRQHVFVRVDEAP